MSLFFFYGSLREGYWNQRVLDKKAKLITLARTDQPAALYIDEKGTVPTAVLGEGTTPLVGEVWHVPDSNDSRIRGLETGYDEKNITVVGDDGNKYNVPIFCHTEAKKCPYIRKPVLVPDGDYTKVVAMDSTRIG